VLKLGGMGVVYKARQTSLGRIVALKMIRTQQHPGPHELARFHVEAEAVARLHHPNVVRIYDFGEHNALPFFSMVEDNGDSLRKCLLPPYFGIKCLAVHEATRSMRPLGGATCWCNSLLAANAWYQEWSTVPEMRQQRWRDFLLAEDPRAEGIQRGDWVFGAEGFRLESQSLQGRAKPRGRGRPSTAALQAGQDLFHNL
jgi:hypothetical protein